jgi:hypothetical protein
LPPVVRVQHTHSKYLYRALQRLKRVWGTVRDRPPAGKPIGRRPHRRGRGVGEGSSGGRARMWKVTHEERCKRVKMEVGIRSSPASHLVFVLEISQILVWKSASRFGT